MEEESVRDDAEEKRGKGRRSKGRKSPNPDSKEKNVKCEPSGLVLLNLRDETRLDDDGSDSPGSTHKSA